MSVVNITKHAKAPIQTAQYVRNGKYPAADLQNLIAGRAGMAAWTRPQLVYRTPGFIIGTAGAAQIPSSVVGSRYRWRFPYHAGPFAQYLMVQFQMAPQNNVGAPTDPIGMLEVSTQPDYSVIVGRARTHWGQSDGSYADVPINFGGGSATLVDDDDQIVALTPLTQYFGRFVDVDYARIQSAVVWEVPLEPTTENGYAPNNVGAGTPIFDEDRADPADMGRRLWAYGAQPLWHHSVDTDAGVRTQGLGELSGVLAQTIAPFTLSATGTTASTPPAYQAQSTFETGTGATVSVAWPAHAENDVALLSIIGYKNGPSFPLVTGWTLLTHDSETSDPDISGTIFWRRAESASESSAVIDIPSDAQDNAWGALITTYRGCITSGSPIDGNRSSSPGGSTTSIVSPNNAYSTTSPNCLIVNVAMVDCPATFSGWANANLTSVTERFDGTYDGGPFDRSMAVTTGILAAPGATGDFTATISLACSAQVLASIALKP